MPMPTLVVPIARSPIMAIVLTVFLAGALACAVAYLPGWWRAAAISMLLAGFAHSLRRDALLLSPRSVVGLKITRDDRCELALRDGRVRAGDVEPSTFVTPWLIVANVRLDGARHVRAVVLFPDAADREARRQLRIRLQHCRSPGARVSGML